MYLKKKLELLEISLPLSPRQAHFLFLKVNYAVIHGIKVTSKLVIARVNMSKTSFDVLIRN
jgi:hypothetical protein